MRPIRFCVPALLAFALAACSSDAPGRITAAGAEPAKVLLAPVCVTFDLAALGATAGGGSGDAPGDVIATENGIPVSVHTFHNLPPDAPAFGDATIVAALAGFGNNQIAQVNNVNLGFDFTGLAFVPSSVTFQWRDYGGHENLKVNGSAIYVGELVAAPSPLGGATVGHVWFWGGGGSFKQGTTTITGAVSVLGVGGQEFYLENVCANP